MYLPATLTNKTIPAETDNDNIVLNWGWVVLLGVLVIAAAVAWVHCVNSGYRGFGGDIEAVRNGWGIKIGIKLGCY